MASNPWPTTEPIPHGCNPVAVALVRAALGLNVFEMTRNLGITATELSECEHDGRWPHGENARRKLVKIAREIDLQIAPPTMFPEVENTSLF